jgi:hypothetical protein
VGELRIDGVTTRAAEAPTVAALLIALDVHAREQLPVGLPKFGPQTLTSL